MYFSSKGDHIIGDGAFPLKEWLMTPYRDNRNITQAKKRHNYLLSSDRIVIEHAFGLLKNGWRRLQYIDCKNIFKAIEIANAVCVLHNFLYNTERRFRRYWP